MTGVQTCALPISEPPCAGGLLTDSQSLRGCMKGSLSVTEGVWVNTGTDMVLTNQTNVTDQFANKITYHENSCCFQRPFNRFRIFILDGKILTCSNGSIHFLLRRLFFDNRMLFFSGKPFLFFSKSTLFLGRSLRIRWLNSILH